MLKFMCSCIFDKNLSRLKFFSILRRIHSIRQFGISLSKCVISIIFDYRQFLAMNSNLKKKKMIDIDIFNVFFSLLFARGKMFPFILLLDCDILLVQTQIRPYKNSQ